VLQSTRFVHAFGAVSHATPLAATSIRPTATGVLLLLATLLLFSPTLCPAQQAPPVSRQTTKHTSTWVPDWPPDSVPDSVWKAVYAPENMEPPNAEWGAPFPRNIVLVGFTDQASREQKQQAIDAISGVVVGGAPIYRGGAYYVRIPDDGTSRSLFRAIKKLRSFPQVELASPDLPEMSMW